MLGAAGLCMCNVKVPIFYPEAYLDDDMITDVVGTPFPTSKSALPY